MSADPAPAPPASLAAAAADRAAAGRALRRAVPRSSHGDWSPPADRLDPLVTLARQDVGRVPELVPIRYGRMAVSPFAYLRGSAAVMAADLARTPSSGLRVQLCGDAHLSNFGGFASPERALVFDLNDFDETLPGPWEWDLKRLAASVAVVGRARGVETAPRRALVTGLAAEYRTALRGFALQSPLQVWYARVEESTLGEQFRTEISGRQAREFERTAARARRRDHARAFAKLTREEDGAPRIVSDPPLIVPVEELAPDDDARDLARIIQELIDRYADTLQSERRRLLSRYAYADLARKVVGVGSVGTRTWVLLLLGRDGQDPLFLQVKEAPPSTLAPFAGASEHANEGQRVVEGQRLMQAQSDILLGWLRTDAIADAERDFYVRQLWDWKTSVDIDTISPTGLAAYARVCAWTLARAHARAGDAVAIGAYLGNGAVFDDALTAFAEAYADQTEADHRALVAAIADGRVAAVSGV